MLEKRLVPVGLVWAILWAGGLAGCRDGTADTREEFAGVMTTDDGRMLGPIVVPERKADAILGAAAAQPASETPGAGREDQLAEEVTVDTSTAEAAANSLVAILQSGDLTPLPDVVSSDQAELMREMVEAYNSLAKAARQLKLALDAKFPDHDLTGFYPISQTLGSLVAAELRVEEMREVSDTEQTAVFAAGPAGGEPRQVELTVKQEEDAWRIVLPDFAPPPDIAAAASQDEGKDAAFADIARRVESGDLATAEAVKEQLTEVAAGTYEPAGGGTQEADESEQ